MASRNADEHAANETTALVAGVAHEINNPITYVLANLADLERSCSAVGEALAGYRAELRALAGARAETRIADLEAKLDECGGLALATELLADATEGAQRIRDLVRDLLALSRAGERTRAPVAIAEVLEQTLRLVSRSLSSRAVLERDFRATREVDGDRARLGQVFLNLLQNAIDACDSAKGGVHRICVRTRDSARGLCVEIEDSGPGVPESLARKIFAPFFTTKAPGDGTGLGLYISRQIVAEHGGSLELAHAPSGGALFRVELPARG